MNSELDVITDAKGRPIRLFLASGQTSDYIGTRAFLPSLPSAGVLFADRGYDAGWFRDALTERGITPCIPSRKTRKIAVQYDKAFYRKRHRIENMFGHLKDLRRIATRYDRCAYITSNRMLTGTKLPRLRQNAKLQLSARDESQPRFVSWPTGLCILHA